MNNLQKKGNSTSRKSNSKPVWLNLDSPQIQQYDAIIGWDTEYRNEEWDLPLEQRGERGNYNEVISYQYSAFSLLNTKWDKPLKNAEPSFYQSGGRYAEGIIYLYENEVFTKRKKLGELLAQILKELGVTIYQGRNKILKILMVAHFSVAEYTTLRDRKELDNKLSEVRKTFVSFNSFGWTIKWDEDRNHIKVQIQWRDTILLASDKEKSLASLGKLIGMEKLELPEEAYDNLAILAKENKSLFEEYALQDARITLGYYCYFMNAFYHEITKRLVKEEPITTSDSTAKFFRKWLEEESVTTFKELNSKEDRKWLETKVLGTRKTFRGKMIAIDKRIMDESLAAHTYKGGLNTFYRLGKYQCSKHEIALDLDISKAYVSAMASLPAIDWVIKPRTSFELLELADEVNREVNHTKIGMFFTKFNFPKETYQSSIGQKSEGGLIYTNEGEDYCTWPEFTEARRLGGIIDAKMIHRGNLYQELTLNNKVYLPFAEYLKSLARERDKHPKGSFLYSFFKLMGNGFYGKLAQGIEYREVWSLSGKRIQLEKSAITCSHYASQTTGIVRAALEVLVNTFNDRPGCKVFSATTDGLMVTIPRPNWLNDEYLEQLPRKNGVVDTSSLLFKELAPEVYQKLISCYPIRLIIQGQKNLMESSDSAKQKNLTESNDLVKQKNLGINNPKWLEVKCIGNEIRTEQTRANYIAHQNTTQGIARGNVPKGIMNSKAIFDKFTDNEKVTEIIVDSLTGLREIKDKGYDLVEKRVLDKKSQQWLPYQRTVNIGYDGKRVLTENGSNSRLATNLEEWEEHRKTALYLKKKKIRIRPEDYLFRWQSKTKGGTLRIQGSRTMTIMRIFIAAAYQLQWVSKDFTSPKLAEQLNQLLKKIDSNKTEESQNKKKFITHESVKKWKQRTFLLKSIPDTKSTRKIITELTQILGVKMNEDKWDKLLTDASS